MRPAPTTPKDRTYAGLRAWMASEHGQVGLARLRLLGASWEREKPHLVVAGMAEIEGGPPLPPLHAFRDRAAFLAGSCWILALIKNRSEQSP